MLKLHHAPNTRSLRILWLLEELALPYEIETRGFAPPTRTYEQQTPTGKYPVLEDDGTVFCESGAILEYVIDRYGEGRLAPTIDSPERALYLQWIHFSEGSAYPPIGNLLWHAFYRRDADELPSVMEDNRVRATAALEFLQDGLGDGEFLLASGFSGADIMTGYTLRIAKLAGLLDDAFATLSGYLEGLEARPALQRAIAVEA